MSDFESYFMWGLMWTIGTIGLIGLALMLLSPIAYVTGLYPIGFEHPLVVFGISLYGIGGVICLITGYGWFVEEVVL